MRTEALALAGALALLLAGCGTPPKAPPVPPRALQDLSEAERLYLEGDFARAEPRFASAARAGDAEAAGWWGRTLLKLERHLEAERAFQQALRDPGASSASDRVGLADALMAQGKAGPAAAAYAALLSDPDAMSRLDPAQVTYRAGVASLRAGLLDEADQRFRRVAAIWPASPCAELARERLSDAGLRRFSVQLGVFSSAEAADRMVARLLGAGVAAQRLTILRAGAALFAVRVGRFQTYDEAQVEAEHLRALGETGAVVP
jgi:tetratricopeptide (TPR) repeat protein